MNYINKVIKNPWKLANIVLCTPLSHILPDSTYLKLKFRATMGQKLDLNNPQTFNQKLQWLKLHDRRPEYTTMVDKYEAKKYVADIIGDEYIIPTYGVWDRFDDIDFDSLPEKFVLKCTHDSGGLVIVKDKNHFDKDAAKKKINKCLKNNYYYNGREWPYKNVKPRIIAEKYMVDESGYELKDYKLFCFEGFAKAMYVAMDRQSTTEEMKWNFYDMDFRKLPFWNAHPNSDLEVKRPESFEQMKKLAEELSQGYPHVRVDFYDINGRVYFGEMTFYHNSGFTQFHPDEWDTTFGELIKLPDSLGGGYLIASKGFILWLHVVDEVRKTEDLTDYKIMCFGGKAKCVFTCTNRQSHEGLNVTFFDPEWNRLPFERHYSADPNCIKKPASYDRMLRLAEEISKNLTFARIDFYEINNHPYFGEITFYPGLGMEEFSPEEWDYTLGSWINLPVARNNRV